ncbi:serine/threonine protein kinase [Nodularia spumigena]|nr:serine/threonine-protein kinase [Nodularia spumigena]MEA5524404.1 serine/threonine-protein kinase [Nodularia spumigena UHCC 0143]MEA5607720.1 serine/threonine-protein kinase [Nodularia spumigena UHCC 0060]MEA5614142.1 serine/threonine-protein kinase [Nodularia spumigena UHCC 0040]
MSHITKSAVHCINPDCQRPYPQPWGNKFCNSCGALLQMLNRYVPLQPLGSGGFAQIYTVWDEKTQTEKVLKVLVEHSPKALELFTQEAEVLIKLRHPGVPRVESDGYFEVNLPTPKPRQLACLVMEKINGLTLEEKLKDYPQGCPEKSVLNWFSQAVKILQELHKRQIIHRDIKPSNLMLRTPSSTTPPTPGSNQEELVLIDFGGVKQFNTAKLRRESSSTKLYSSGYSPPEQMTGGNVGPAADFYALGRTMIELLTGKYPPELGDPQTGVLHWRNQVNVNPKLADLLDEMVLEDVRSRPVNAIIIQKRLTKIIRTSSQPGLFSRIKNSVQQATTEVSRQFTLLIQAIEQGFNNLTTAIGKTVLFIAVTIFQVLQACWATIWAMLLTGFGACVGTIIGYIVAARTVVGEQISEYIFRQLPELVSDTQPVMTTEIIVFVGAGLGTAWGLTISGCFGQRRRFLVASLMGMISYGLSWLVLQITTQDSGEGLLGVILVAVFLLTLSIGFRSHHIVHAVVAALGTVIIFAMLIIFGFPTTVFQVSGQPLWLELYLPIVFFSLVSLLMSFWLGVSYYLIVPGLRFLGWR